MDLGPQLCWDTIFHIGFCQCVAILALTLTDKPTLCLKITRDRVGGLEVKDYVSKNDVKALQRLYIEGSASSRDIYWPGWTHLYTAVRLRKLKIASFLLDAGADVYVKRGLHLPL